MSQKPNILLIHADQHRFDCLGAYGNKEIKTPHLDAIAAEGVVFENSFCPYPICTPSRYSLLSGLYVHEHRGISNSSTLSPDTPTLPRCLRENGYATTAVGKMHFTPTYLDVGFDKMFLAEQAGPGRYDDDYHRWLRDEDTFDRLDLIDQVQEYRDQAPDDYWQQYGSMRSDLDEKHHSTTWIAEQAMCSIQEWGDESNFLMVGFIKPHHPNDPPEPWDTMYNPEELSLLPGWTDDFIHGDDGKGFFDFNGLTAEECKRVMALYYASVSQIDHHVGRMVSLLKEKGLYDNTIIIYTSDHGDYMGYHHRILKGSRMYETVMRVPLIIKFAADHKLPERDQRLINNIDLAPTLLSAAGITVPDSMSGGNVLDQSHDPQFVLGHFHDEYMSRSQTRKLLVHGSAKPLFFDLENDPNELENRYDDPAYQDEISELQAQLKDWPTFDNPVPNHIDHDAPKCQAANVPDGDTGLEEYFRKKIAGQNGQPILDGSP